MMCWAQWTLLMFTSSIDDHCLVDASADDAPYWKFLAVCKVGYRVIQFWW